MVKVLAPPKPPLPLSTPGTRVSVMPSPHILFLEGGGYYDALGRDPLQQYQVWPITDPTERVEKLEEILAEWPKQKDRRQILFKAARRGDEAIVRYLVGTGLKVHPDIWQDEEGEGKSDNGEDEDDPFESDKDDPQVAPLHIAAVNGKLGCIKIFIEEGHLDVDTLDEFGRTPFLAAAGSRDFETSKYLLEKGADPTARSDTRIKITRELMEEYAGAGALEIAAGHRGNIEVVKLILEHLQAKERSKEGGRESSVVTPLAIKGAAGADFEMLKLLLQRGAYPMEDKNGKTKGELLNEEQKQAINDALPGVIELGDLESIKLLLSYQYPTDKDGNLLPFEVPEALHKFVTYGAYQAVTRDDVEKFEFIHSFGLREHDTMSLDDVPEGQPLNYQHLLDKAAEHGAVKCAELMIDKYGANPHQHRIPHCSKPLWWAAAANKPEMLRCLLEKYKADIHLGNGRFATGPTALWAAITLKSLDCVAILLQHGGPVDHVDDEILNADKPITAVLIPEYGERTPVRFQTEENAKEAIEGLTTWPEHFNPLYVHVEIGPEDRNWISKLKPRKPDDELREEGPKARELNGKEAAKTKDLDETDPRRNMVEYPTIKERQDELEDDDDLLPRWNPAFLPVARGEED